MDDSTIGLESLNSCDLGIHLPFNSLNERLTAPRMKGESRIQRQEEAEPEILFSKSVRDAVLNTALSFVIPIPGEAALKGLSL